MLKVAFNLQPGQNNHNVEKSAPLGREIIFLTLLKTNVLEINNTFTEQKAITPFKHSFITTIIKLISL